jgi:hypothetical protein
MTQEIRKDLSVAAIMATMVFAALLLISARAAAEHAAPAAKTPEISARPR